MQREFFQAQTTPETITPKPRHVKIMLGILWWSFLILLGVLSFLFPPIGLPVAVLLYHNGKKIYALFPTLGILLLIFFQLYNQLMILLTR